MLVMLNILEVCAPKLGMNLAALGPRSAAYWHLLVEAKKLAYADLYAFNADPGFVSVPVSRLISKTYAAELCSRIDPRKASTPEPKGDPVGGTVYLTVADRWGNMVSFIYSIYDSFGSGVTVPGYGFVLNDRGALFSLDPKSPQCHCPAQASVPYAAARVPDEGRPAGHGIRTDGRQPPAKAGVGAMRAARLAGLVARQRPKALRRSLMAAKFSRQATRLLSLDAT